jgi:hypothetical protein
MDFEVIVHLTGRLHRQVRDMPPGSRITGFTIAPPPSQPGQGWPTAARRRVQVAQSTSVTVTPLVSGSYGVGCRVHVAGTRRLLTRPRSCRLRRPGRSSWVKIPAIRGTTTPDHGRRYGTWGQPHMREYVALCGVAMCSGVTMGIKTTKYCLQIFSISICCVTLTESRLAATPS